MKKLLYTLFIFVSCNVATYEYSYAQIVVAQGQGLQSVANATTLTTAALDLSANTLYLVCVATTDDVPETPTLSATESVTSSLEETVNYNTTGTPLNRLLVYRVMSATAKTGVQFTATFTGSQSAIKIFTIKVSGVATAGTNGSDAVVQSVTGSANSTTTPTATLAAYSNPNNAAVYIVATTQVSSWSTSATPEAGWTMVSREIAGNQPSITYGYQLNATDVTPSITTASTNWGMVAIELKPASTRRIISSN